MLVLFVDQGITELSDVLAAVAMKLAAKGGEKQERHDSLVVATMGSLSYTVLPPPLEELSGECPAACWCLVLISTLSSSQEASDDANPNDCSGFLPGTTEPFTLEPCKPVFHTHPRVKV
ncbi:hypothetical protein CB1_000288007 [Camelus ferus]|nr:hypothetical protein CB1_000288007 [Camelus ferus]